MQHAIPISDDVDAAAVRLQDLQRAIEHAAHLLPSQGPIEVFVHHNTLHAFEELDFESAVLQAKEIYGCQPYLEESAYRDELGRGRILTDDLSAVLLDDLEEEADRLIGFMGTRYHLRLAMLEHSLRVGRAAELRWLITETDALQRFRPEAPAEVRRRMIEQTRHWVFGVGSATEEQPQSAASHRDGKLLESLIEQFGPVRPEAWTDATWEAFTLHLLWRVCHQGTHAVPHRAAAAPAVTRHRDLLYRLTGRDTDGLINEFLIPFCAAYLDQGFASWVLPGRDSGFYASFLQLYQGCPQVARWRSGLGRELRRLQDEGMTALESIDDSLKQLGVVGWECAGYLQHTLLALRGWAGMIQQMETNAEWAVRPASRGTLEGYLAVRLILERLALDACYRDEFCTTIPLAQMRADLRHRTPHEDRAQFDQRAYLVFQLAQVRGWSPRDLHRQSHDVWCRLVEEIEAFGELPRRRIYHLAFERRYRNRALDAVALHAADVPPASDPRRTQRARPSFQVVTCIDDREESFRRHLEEAAPTCETYSAAGFFAVAMYFRGASEAHFRPLCPVVIKPDHYVTEEVAYSLAASSRNREDARRLLGTASHRWHTGSRSLIGGIVTAALGSFASIPLVMRTLFPRLTAQARRTFGSLLQPPPVTELHIERESGDPGPSEDQLGYSRAEMADIVARILQDIGLIHNFSRLIVFVGHGSGSLNNPHESAYNCGACSGGRGGPNARAFARMANDLHVRAALAARGLVIPDDAIFVGAYHNTCNEDVVYYDLDHLPRSHRAEFERVLAVMDTVRARNAHERCRRFESARLDLSLREALEHVEGRAEDLSQARPEFNHATNALCFVGHREWSRGLFLDRRAFLTSYDPSQDDRQGTILARILAAAVPVCAGISLEYYFSCVDPSGYGCGSKLPHNITSLLGVMEGATSDMRPGLSQQMIEIHEPLRLIFVIETTVETMLNIMAANDTIDRLVRRQWVQLALLDPESRTLQWFHKDRFEPYHPQASSLPSVSASSDWYRYRREHLEFARIADNGPDAVSREEAASWT